MDYKEKYLKYKNKYLELKNQIGGTFTCMNCGIFNTRDGPRCFRCRFPLPTTDFGQINNSILKINSSNNFVPYRYDKSRLGYVDRIFNSTTNNWDFNPSGTGIDLDTVISLPDYPNRCLRDYMGGPIFGNSINVHAITYRFRPAFVTQIDTGSRRVFNRITISGAQPYPKYRELLEHIRNENTGTVPPNLYLLCSIYTLSGRALDPFLDVQLCISGGAGSAEIPFQTAQREMIEEAGLQIYPTKNASMCTIGINGNIDYTLPENRIFEANNTDANLHTFFVNADGNTDGTPNVVFNQPGNSIPIIGADDRRNRSHVMIYGNLATLEALVQSVINRTDLRDIQGIALVKLT